MIHTAVPRLLPPSLVRGVVPPRPPRATRPRRATTPAAAAAGRAVPPRHDRRRHRPPQTTARHRPRWRDAPPLPLSSRSCGPVREDARRGRPRGLVLGGDDPPLLPVPATTSSTAQRANGIPRPRSRRAALCPRCREHPGSRPRGLVHGASPTAVPRCCSWQLPHLSAARPRRRLAESPAAVRAATSSAAVFPHGRPGQRSAITAGRGVWAGAGAEGCAVARSGWCHCFRVSVTHVTDFSSVQNQCSDLYNTPLGQRFERAQTRAELLPANGNEQRHLFRRCGSHCPLYNTCKRVLPRATVFGWVRYG